MNLTFNWSWMQIARVLLCAFLAFTAGRSLHGVNDQDCSFARQRRKKKLLLKTGKSRPKDHFWHRRRCLRPENQSLSLGKTKLSHVRRDLATQRPPRDSLGFSRIETRGSCAHEKPEKFSLPPLAQNIFLLDLSQKPMDPGSNPDCVSLRLLFLSDTWHLSMQFCLSGLRTAAGLG